MTESIQNQLKRAFSDAETLYHRLILIVGGCGVGKTAVLKEMSERMGRPVVNVNLELSEKLLELTSRQRSLHLPAILGDLVASDSAVILLDNTEILFDKDLQQDPLRLLQGLSRNRTVIASWNGIANGTKLIYAEPGHPEYRSYDHVDTPMVCMDKAISSEKAKQTKGAGKA